ncbi:hypothetical protein FDUTEX481_00207 [Tolypothrix sp. PCC 7601]|nr:hypothetical protein FDUTEX481_00207 [Tolypothrix sp. PCC 7601]
MPYALFPMPKNSIPLWVEFFIYCGFYSQQYAIYLLNNCKISHKNLTQ